MNIGQVAKEVGISAKMIRYYEEIGLLERVQRSQSGYRIYNDNDRHTLKFIHRARELGFSVVEISELLTLWRNKERASKDVKQLTMQHIHTLEEKAKHLQAMAETLRQLVCHCHGNKRPECPIIEELSS